MVEVVAGAAGGGHSGSYIQYWVDFNSQGNCTKPLKF